MPAGQQNHGHYYLIIIIIFTTSINYATNYDSSVFSTACLPGGWGLQVGEVTCLGGVTCLFI